MEEDQNVNIGDYRDFCKNLELLLENKGFLDDSKGPYELENVNTRCFLKAMGAWLEDAEGGGSFFDNPCNSHITWSDLYKLIQASAIYE